MARDHRLRRVSAALYGEPWAITEAKLGEIAEILERRRAGEVLDETRLAALTLRRGAEDDEPQMIVQDGVAVLPIDGVLAPRMNLMMQISGGTSYQQIATWADQAAADSQVKAIVLAIDSPGGSVLGLEEAAARIRAAAAQKPVVAVAALEADSAAYYLACAAREIVASPSALLGSIGTISIHREGSRAEQNAGYTTTIIKAGKHKADGNPYEPLSEQSRATIEERVQAYNDKFIQAVAVGRRVSAETVQERFGQGKVFPADRAVALGLADRIATLDQVISQLATSSRASTTPQGIHAVNPQIKQALIARGLVTADATDAQCQAALVAYFAGRGTSVPADQAAVLAALQPSATPPAQPATPPAAPAPAAAAPPAGSPAPAAPAAPPAADAQQAAEQARTEERARMRDLEARGQLLGISAEAIQQAQDAGWSVQQALDRWTKDLAARQQPVSRDVTITGAGSPLDAIHQGATDALCARLGIALVGPDGKPRAASAHAGSFRHKRLIDIAGIALQAAGVRVPDGDPDEVAKQYLSLCGTVPRSITAVGAASVNQPGLYPNLLSNLAGKIMDAATQYAGISFRQWSKQLPSVPDFKPKTLLRVGELGELPEIAGDDDFEQVKTSEDASWVSVGRYGAEWAFTPQMMVDDDLSAFMEISQEQQFAHDRTLNRLCVDLLAGNPTLPDGIALFHASHGNLDTGAAISATSLGTARKLMRLQKGVSNKAYLSHTVKVLLVPAELETLAEQTLYPTNIVPATDSNVNVFRGKIDVVCEPMLSDASAVVWYALADKQVCAVVVFLYQTGFENGKKSTYFTPKNGCQMFQIEGRFGAAANNFRGAVKNPGP